MGGCSQSITKCVSRLLEAKIILGIQTAQLMNPKGNIRPQINLIIVLSI